MDSDSFRQHYRQKHLFWSLTAFDKQDHGLAGRCRYPVRALRYWFMDHLIKREFAVEHRPLRICEVGVGRGALLEFVTRAYATSDGARHPPWIASWDAVSRRIEQPTLRALGYGTCIEADIEHTHLQVNECYDVMVLLHVLEHLSEPERAIERLLRFLRPGGIMIGGAPTLPDCLRIHRERQLRTDAAAFGHVSVITPRRVRQAAQALRLSVELLTGAFALRWTGAGVERSRLWLRLNLMFGAIFPAWPGELYWALRKPPQELR
jgi:2-polyprenyl-3-methyl-5-hydroxy-6-metoxy-1,4-benzoquinol methylase